MAKKYEIYVPRQLIRARDPTHLYWYILIRMFCIMNGTFNPKPIISPLSLASVFYPHGGRRIEDRAKLHMKQLEAEGVLTQVKKDFYVLSSVLIESEHGYVKVPLRTVKEIHREPSNNENLLATYCIIMATRDAARNYKVSFIGQEKLAEELGVSDRTVRKYIHRLEEMKLLFVKRRSYDPELGKKPSNLYCAYEDSSILDPSADTTKSNAAKKRTDKNDTDVANDYGIPAYHFHEYVPEFDPDDFPVAGKKSYRDLTKLL